ncbi:MAG: hypothetical protein BM555_02075 [Crocinitomix sp. MedPE-SWsnd]|nr:MAG: hypothetical protein BM555_02075 [Crocinitomix sp. MedPE-SWsnd]
MKYVLIISIALLALSCKDKNDGIIIYGHEYFPIDQGKYVSYDVMDIVHDDPSAVHDTDYYQIKEVIGEIEIDGEGDETQKLYRYIRQADTLSWGLKDVWIVKKTTRSVEVVEENQRKIKMAFSISYDQYWDCNGLNNLDAEQCYYSNIYLPISVGGLDYDSSVVVEHEDFTSYIEVLRSYEVYALNIGKIQSVNRDIEISNGDTLDVYKGTELFYTAFDYGTE